MKPDLDPWPLTIATYNIHSAVGTDGVCSAERIADVLHEINADVFALQEVPLSGNGTKSVLEVLRESTGFHVASGQTCIVDECGFGNAVLSRYPIQEVRTVDLTFG